MVDHATGTHPVSEKVVDEYLIQRVREQGGTTIRLIPNTQGIPDRLVILPGNRFYLVELKTRGGELRPGQKVWHRRQLERTQTKVRVLWSKAEVDQFILSTIFEEEPE